MLSKSLGVSVTCERERASWRAKEREKKRISPTHTQNVFFLDFSYTTSHPAGRQWRKRAYSRLEARPECPSRSHSRGAWQWGNGWVGQCLPLLSTLMVLWAPLTHHPLFSLQRPQMSEHSRLEPRPLLRPRCSCQSTQPQLPPPRPRSSSRCGHRRLLCPACPPHQSLWPFSGCRANGGEQDV